MKALVYHGPKQMTVNEVPVPELRPDEVLIRVAYSGICGSELSGYEGKNSLRKPPLIMGHEFSGHIEAIGDAAQKQFPRLAEGQPATANPLIFCRHCAYCLSGRHQLCPERKLLSASLPGSNAEFVAVRADAIHVLPEDLELNVAALTEPAACAIHAVRLAQPQPEETALVVGAGPIGLLVIQALLDRGNKTIYALDTNDERLAMAVSLGAKPVRPGDQNFLNEADIAVDAVGLPVTRQTCIAATRNGGRIIWVGLHEATSLFDINDLIRREITTYGAFAYNPLDFQNALSALYQGRLGLNRNWTRIEPVERGTACFEELIRGSSIAKIWLEPASAQNLS